ncbi:MAG: hypothetical protein R3A10_16200 [Caldilineaceae bacterium]
MTVRYLFFVCLTLFLTAFLGYGTYNTAKLLRTWTPDRNLLLLPGETIVRLILIGVCIGLGILSGLAPATLGWTAHDLDRQILWGMGWGVVVAGIFTITTPGSPQRPAGASTPTRSSNTSCPTTPTNSSG